MVDYSKWDKMVLSDDEDDRIAPLYDPETLFRMREEKMSHAERKNDRLKRMAALETKKKELMDKEPKDDAEREAIQSELQVIYQTERQLARL